MLPRDQFCHVAIEVLLTQNTRAQQNFPFITVRHQMKSRHVAEFLQPIGDLSDPVLMRIQHQHVEIAIGLRLNVGNKLFPVIRRRVDHDQFHSRLNSRNVGRMDALVRRRPVAGYAGIRTCFPTQRLSRVDA